MTATVIWKQTVCQGYQLVGSVHDYSNCNCYITYRHHIGVLLSQQDLQLYAAMVSFLANILVGVISV